jgi:hypothetical protein
VLCQLSYAPRFGPRDCSRACAGILPRMSTEEHDDTRTREAQDDDLLAAQQGKGYGEDEGERDETLDDEQ